MDSSDKFCLKWNNFNDNASTTFKELQQDSDFADVTLVGEGKEPILQIDVHKIILAASSPVFRDMLKLSKHPHPVIYMRGIATDDLAAIVEFIYQGEVSVYQENLENFMAIAQELKVKGLGSIEHPSEGKETLNKQNPNKKRKSAFPVDLMGMADEENIPLDQTAQKSFMAIAQEPKAKGIGGINYINEERYPYKLQKTNRIFPKQTEHDFSLVDLSDVKNEEYDLDRPTDTSAQPNIQGSFSLGNQTVLFKESEFETLDDQIMSMMELSEMGWICKMCGKLDSSSNATGKCNMKVHIEGRHIEGVENPCTICGNILKTRDSLRKHMQRSHKPKQDEVIP